MIIEDTKKSNINSNVNTNNNNNLTVTNNNNNFNCDTDSTKYADKINGEEISIIFEQFLGNLEIFSMLNFAFKFHCYQQPILFMAFIQFHLIF
jgi:hypothetical protein